jgi:hypothetical protein
MTRILVLLAVAILPLLLAGLLAFLEARALNLPTREQKRRWK